MAFVDFSDLTAELQQQAVALRPYWEGPDFPFFQFWVTKGGRLSRAPGHHRMTDQAAMEFLKAFDEPPPPSKGSLDGWTGSPRFSLCQE